MSRKSWRVTDYDLGATLTSGQAFRWRRRHERSDRDRSPVAAPGSDISRAAGSERPRSGEWWEGVIGAHWVRLRQTGGQLAAEAAAPVDNWDWLRRYLQLDRELGSVLATFPRDSVLGSAMLACRGLRLLRQDPWECLASFILSSTKQIVQIQQIVELICARFGEPVATPPGTETAWAFPAPARLAAASEAELRACKMGFRAPNLHATAERVAAGLIDLSVLGGLPVEVARARLMELPGVGRKIADCVLLFAYGFPTAFPVDVWVLKALRRLYFPRGRVTRRRLEEFSRGYFGPEAGYAQQYLFHYVRVHRGAELPHSIQRTRTGPLPGTRGRR